MCAISRMRYTYFNATLAATRRRAKDERGKTEDLAETIRIMFSAMKRSSADYGRVLACTNVEERIRLDR